MDGIREDGGDMKAMEVVYEVARNAGVSVSSIGVRLGKTRQYATTAFSNNRNPRADNIAAMLGALGWKLCAVPEDLVTDEMLVIDPPEEQ